ncbi:MAG: nucleotidyltransferase domain-containing protein, partial [Lachnospiraceae bacterium]|nr:nucleotidyltransferase domain-containing protein [Lachnospiraceae bacterium]
MGQNEETELVEGILKSLGNSVLSIILYGSVARGDNTGESDVDIAIILSKKLSPELNDLLSDAIVDLDLK